MNHIRIWTSAFLLLFLFSSAGLTIVVEVCCEPAEDQEATSSFQQEMSNGCPQDIDGLTRGMQIKNVDKCHQRFLAGGLSGMTAVFQKDVSPSAISKVTIPASAIQLNVRSAEPPRLLRKSLLTRDPSPPSVEKCILTSTFLI